MVCELSSTFTSWKCICVVQRGSFWILFWYTGCCHGRVSYKDKACKRMSMCVCVCVCVCHYLSTCELAHAHSYMHTQTYAHIICTHACTHTCTHTHTHTHTYTHTHTQTYIQKCSVYITVCSRVSFMNIHTYSEWHQIIWIGPLGRGQQCGKYQLLHDITICISFVWTSVLRQNPAPTHASPHLSVIEILNVVFRVHSHTLQGLWSKLQHAWPVNNVRCGVLEVLAFFFFFSYALLQVQFRGYFYSYILKEREGEGSVPSFCVMLPSF